MTEEQIRLVKNSWKSFRQIDAELIGDVFYSKLFLDTPKLQKLFPAALQPQQKKLVNMLHYIISRLDQPEVITADIRALALRHKGYGVKAEYYSLVGNALLWTIERGAGNEWNNTIKEAWLACYTLLANTMMAATKPTATTKA
ncbi:hemoglobin [Adhaeribacter arboris]|uniref:Hemoglobin n=1 Tax=Adhaeribacter arboris TaxID=2072846 RepID=A0A2T2YIL4_9BACT|nr:globin domain-containing protein [Adhaeribacter arboris]PSR55354.1 hemoglobin [Adhaeribacter arboris]